MPGKRRSAGEGSIFRRKDGLYVAELGLPPGPDGKTRVWRRYSRLRRIVAAALAEVLAQKQRGDFVGTSDQTVKDYLTEWITGQKNSLAPQTWPSYEAKVRRYLIPALGHLTLAKLTPQHVQRMLDAMSEKGLQPRTVAYCRAVLRAALTDAVRWGSLTRNAAALAQPPKIASPDVQPITRADAQRILDAVCGDRLEALFAVVLAIGIRQGEALGLGWSDVDLERGEVRIVHALQLVNGRLEVRETKTKGSRRVISLPRFAVTILRAHRVRQLAERLRAGERWQESGLVFTSTVGTPINRHNLLRTWRRLLVKAEVPHARFYDLRHTCASLLAAEGLSLKEVSALLGHSTIRVTADFYTHLFPSSGTAAAEAMEGLFGGSERSKL